MLYGNNKIQRHMLYIHIYCTIMRCLCVEQVLTLQHQFLVVYFTRLYNKLTFRTDDFRYEKTKKGKLGPGIVTMISLSQTQTNDCVCMQEILLRGKYV